MTEPHAPALDTLRHFFPTGAALPTLPYTLPDGSVIRPQGAALVRGERMMTSEELYGFGALATQAPTRPEGPMDALSIVTSARPDLTLHAVDVREDPDDSGTLTAVALTGPGTCLLGVFSGYITNSCAYSNTLDVQAAGEGDVLKVEGNTWPECSEGDYREYYTRAGTCPGLEDLGVRQKEVPAHVQAQQARAELDRLTTDTPAGTHVSVPVDLIRRAVSA